MIAILMASILSQCATSITDNTQTICGQKAFSGLVDLQDAMVVRGIAYTLAPYGGIHIASDNNMGFQFIGNKSAGDPAAELTITSTVPRSSGFAIATSNSDGVQTFAADVHGNIFNGCASALDGGSFRCGAFIAIGESGALNFTVGEGLYVTTLGKLPVGYWGHHGAVTVGNSRAMIAGFLFDAENVDSEGGNQTDKKFLIGYKGQWETQAGITSSTLLICDGNDVSPESDNSDRYTGVIPDGGHSWYIATDAGHAQAGAIFPWVTNVHQACQCDPLFYDGGLTSSWRKLSDRTECTP